MSSPQTAKRMAKFALSLQENPKSPLFFINFYADLVRIDGIISEEQHYLEIAANGEIYTDYKQRIARANVREDHLGTLLLRLMPRTEHKSQSLSRLSTSHVTL